MRKILASLDIGSDSIKLVVGEFFRGRFHVLAASHVLSMGVKKGIIVDSHAFMPQLQEIFRKCEDMIGQKIPKVIITVPSNGLHFLLTEGESTITNEDHQIKNSDIVHAMQAATYNKIAENREIVSISPVSFLLDGDKNVLNPVGLEATKISVKTLVVTVLRKNILPIFQCLEKIGVEVVDFTISSIANYHECQKNNKAESVGAIIDIGSSITPVSIFQKGLLTAQENLSIGGENIVKDLAYVFKLSRKDALLVKKELASLHKRGVSASIKKEFTNKEGESITISEYEATEVASSRMEEILKLAKKQINLLTKKEIHYIMITGGVSEMANFPILVEEIFGHHAMVFQSKSLGARSNIYSSSVGLLKYYNEKMKKMNQEFSIFTEEEMEELSNSGRKMNFGENSVLGKLFGYFFDN